MRLPDDIWNPVIVMRSRLDNMSKGKKGGKGKKGDGKGKKGDGKGKKGDKDETRGRSRSCSHGSSLDRYGGRSPSRSISRGGGKRQREDSRSRGRRREYSRHRKDSRSRDYAGRDRSRSLGPTKGGGKFGDKPVETGDNNTPVQSGKGYG